LTGLRYDSFSTIGKTSGDSGARIHAHGRAGEEGQKQELRAVKKAPKMVRAASPSGG